MADFNFINFVANSVLADNFRVDLGFRGPGLNLKENEITARGLERPNQARALIKITNSSSNENEISQYRLTGAVYYIVYQPLGMMKGHKGRIKIEEPYKIIHDLTNFNVWITGPAHFNLLAESIPEYNFLRNETTFSDDMFELAKANPNVKIPFICKAINDRTCKYVRVTTDFWQKYYDSLPTASDIENYIDIRSEISDNAQVKKERKENYEYYDKIAKEWEE